MERRLEITALEYKKDKKVHISLDGEETFFLYEKEVKSYQLEQGMQLPCSLYEEIIQIVEQRAKQKAVLLLQYRDRTEYELREKLKLAYYPAEVIDRTIQYLQEYHYIEEERIAIQYVESKKNKKSKKQLRIELMQKGIAKEIIERVLSEQIEQETQTIQSLIRKKTKGEELSLLSKEEREKIARSLYQKGFSMSEIRKNLDL